jgi:glycosyltransferase involved in cell wall biosynthesis
VSRIAVVQGQLMSAWRVMVVHNSYQQLGGEDTVVEAEVALLEARAHAVMRFGRHNDEIPHLSRVQLAAGTIWSSRTVRDVTNALRQFRPDVVHVHNTFPLISPSIFWAAARARTPIVQTLHNFRLLCPQAMFLRGGKVCEDCLGRSPVPGMVHACYRGSTAQSAVLGGMLMVHRAIGTYDQKISRYIVLNEFCRRKFIQGGLPPDRVVVKPNFVDYPVAADGARNGFLFVGRLSPEKGVSVLATAVGKLVDVSLRVAGCGPDGYLLEGASGVSNLGALPPEAVRAEMGAATALVLPSIWYENFPRTLVEAFACGLPVIASRIGALADLVDDGVTGLLFEAGDARDLAAKMRWAMHHPEQMAEMGRNARWKYEAEFTADRNYAQLMAIYDDVIREARVGAAA